ncbi:MAG: hypothetical protein V3U75_09450 [Methylococcaceae bacterium]
MSNSNIIPYKNMMTPYDKLKSLTESEKNLKPGVSFAICDQVAMDMTDNQAAKILNLTTTLLVPRYIQLFDKRV